jgi:hypothetical protein
MLFVLGGPSPDLAPPHPTLITLYLQIGPRTCKGLPIGAPRVPFHGIPWAPKGPLPWGGPGPPPMGSIELPRVPSPMGPLPWDPFGLPRVPSHGVPPHPIPIPTPAFRLYNGLTKYTCQTRTQLLNENTIILEVPDPSKAGEGSCFWTALCLCCNGGHSWCGVCPLSTTNESGSQSRYTPHCEQGHWQYHLL